MPMQIEVREIVTKLFDDSPSGAEFARNFSTTDVGILSLSVIETGTVCFRFRARR